MVTATIEALSGFSENPRRTLSLKMRREFDFVPLNSSETAVTMWLRQAQ
jgi:hypothetical protein